MSGFPGKVQGGVSKPVSQSVEHAANGQFRSCVAAPNSCHHGAPLWIDFMHHRIRHQPRQSGTGPPMWPSL